MRQAVFALVLLVVSLPVGLLAGETAHGEPTHVAEAVSLPPSPGELGATVLVVLLAAGVLIWLADLIREQLPSAE